jgi:probable rRNA maturation factor
LTQIHAERNAIVEMSVKVCQEGEVAGWVSRRAVERYAGRMLEALGLSAAELSVLLCDAAVMRRLNRKYRGKDRAADVLSFSMAEGEAVSGPALLLGDVVISLPTAARQAEAKGGKVVDEVKMLLAHGLLHLLGFDHRNRLERSGMDFCCNILMGAATRRTSPRTSPKARRSRSR